MSSILRPVTYKKVENKESLVSKVFQLKDLPKEGNSLTHEHVAAIATQVITNKLEISDEETRKLQVMVELSNRKIEKLEKELEYTKKMLEAQILEKRTTKRSLDDVRQIKVGTSQNISVAQTVVSPLESNPIDIHPEIYEDHTSLQTTVEKPQLTTQVVSAPPMTVTLNQGVATVSVPTSKKKGLWDSLGL